MNYVQSRCASSVLSRGEYDEALWDQTEEGRGMVGWMDGSLEEEQALWEAVSLLCFALKISPFSPLPT